jgi:outer membrane protein TolC
MLQQTVLLIKMSLKSSVMNKPQFLINNSPHTSESMCNKESPAFLLTVDSNQAINAALRLFLVFFLWSHSLYSETLSLDLKKGLELALSHSPRHREALIELEQARLSELIQQAEHDPSLTASVDQQLEAETRQHKGTLQQTFYGGVSLSTSLSHSEQPTANDTRDWTLSISKSLLKGGTWVETRQGLMNAIKNSLKQVNTYRLARRKLLLDVRELYYDIEEKRQTLKIQELRLERAKKNLEHAVEKDEPMDIAIAKLEVPRNEISLLRSRMNLSTDLDSLRVLLGLPLETEIDIPPLILPKPGEVDLTSDLKIMLDKHEDIINANLDLAHQKRQVKSRQWGLTPSLTLSASLNHSGEGPLSEMEQDEKSVGLDLSWPLGIRQEWHQLRSAKLELRDQELALARIRLEKSGSLRRLHRNILEAMESLHLQEQTVKLEQFRVELYRDRWQEGQINILEMVRSEGDLENSKVNLVSRRLQYIRSVENYHFAVGRKAF